MVDEAGVAAQARGMFLPCLPELLFKRGVGAFAAAGRLIQEACATREKPCQFPVDVQKGLERGTMMTVILHGMPCGSCVIGVPPSLKSHCSQEKRNRQCRVVLAGLSGRWASRGDCAAITRAGMDHMVCSHGRRRACRQWRLRKSPYGLGTLVGWQRSVK
ncbi:hypothetical protein DVU_0844 [Nitratidesulfovibrio vulgaris str. Hildenborough]|uniref:Uncharacterized protein n=1 Tax=Nitratidesulfovibrio vulgaris (strain ATCC 29579 / DSM 644 / CCUG 34227 / NCIMB 8303 / VKM B-1760 / Hildenborough) TaxID=882 RepID=Q72DT5_NITV2|nr:hypothetical protein DVU_0844 [Nitratidesulfovibrio vulgaris str. Hildenborough]